MTTTVEDKDQIAFEADYVALRRYGFSVSRLVERYPDGVPDHIIARALRLSVAEVEGIYQAAVTRLQELLKV